MKDKPSFSDVLLPGLTNLMEDFYIQDQQNINLRGIDINRAIKDIEEKHLNENPKGHLAHISIEE